MSFLDWWRRRASVDPTATDTSASLVAFVAPPDREPPEEELAALRNAAEAHRELRSVYVFRDGRRGEPGTLVVGILLDDAVDDRELQAIVADLQARVRAEDWGAQRVAVEPLGPGLLEEADAAVGPLFERVPRGS
jgi:hypothetical protein